MSTESRELVLHAENDATLWNRRRPEFVKNLIRKKVKGSYDSAKAIKLWKYFADEVAASYATEYRTGGPHGKYGIFSVADRKAAARDFAQQFENEWRYDRKHLQAMYPSLFKSKKKAAKKKSTTKKKSSRASEKEQAAALRAALRGS